MINARVNPEDDVYNNNNNIVILIIIITTVETVVAYVTVKVKWGPDKSRTELCNRAFHRFCDLEFVESSITLSNLSGASLLCFMDDLAPLPVVVVVVAVVEVLGVGVLSSF